MGTRHIIMVIVDGKTKVSQYGQWDGYLEGQGATILDFIEDIYLANQIDKFKDKVRLCTSLTDQVRIDNINNTPDWPRVYPHLSRDAGGAILDMIFKSNGLELWLDNNFAYDSLMCEFGYVIDLDNEVVEVYKGFNRDPLQEDERFYKQDFEPSDAIPTKYYPIKLAFKIPFSEASLGFTKEHEKACGYED